MRQQLASAQQRVLDQFHLIEDDLVYAQRMSYKKGNAVIDAVVDSIGTMFDAFSAGDFPELPTEAFDATRNEPVDEKELLESLRAIFSDKLVQEPRGEESVLCEYRWKDTVLFYNTVASRINESPSFKLELVKILLENQNEVKKQFS